MTVEADIYSTLSPLVAGRCFPDVAPLGTVEPFIVYQQVGGQTANVIHRVVPTMKNGRFQITVWGKKRSEVADLALQAESAIILSTLFQGTSVGAATALHDGESQSYGSLQHFSVWSSF